MEKNEEKKIIAIEKHNENINDQIYFVVSILWPETYTKDSKTKLLFLIAFTFINYFVNTIVMDDGCL